MVPSIGSEMKFLSVTLYFPSDTGLADARSGDIPFPETTTAFFHASIMALAVPFSR